MTFILSEVSQLGVIMASDSAATERNSETNEIVNIQEKDKRQYNPFFNIGFSIWGSAEVGSDNTPIIDWIYQIVNEYKEGLKDKSNLKNNHTAQIAELIKTKLNEVFNLPNNTKNKDLKLGIHIGGFVKSNASCIPSILHVNKTNDMEKFKISNHPWEEQPGLSSIIRNGYYEEFAIFWDALFGVEKSFINLLRIKFKNSLKLPKDPIRIRVEWIGNWVRLMCHLFKQAYLPEVIGKKVNILFLDESHHRSFEILEIHEKTINKVMEITEKSKTLLSPSKLSEHKS